MNRAMKPILCATLVTLTATMSEAAFALTADLAKKCDAAAFQAYPRQQTGSTVGIAEREAFRKDCIAKNGNIAQPAAQPQSAPATPSK